jgi:lipopolysaccharide/colanic/teichoic acid biosynthesis glycosyltransferase
MRSTILSPRTEPTQGKLRDLFRFTNIRKSILHEPGKEVYDYLSEFVNLESDRSMVFMTKTSFNIFTLSDNYFHTLVNLGRINDVQKINKFFEAVNEKLPFGGTFVCCAETKNQRKERILKKYPPVLAHFYYLFDFIFKRIFPKLPVTKKLYFKITGGRNRVLSKTEILGRLYSCGFNVIDYRKVNGKTYFIMKKISEPSFVEQPSYGPICKMARYGKNGKKINVYKFRTMHPYSEFLQQYIYETNNLQEGGKFKDDFRISTLGKFMRRYWIDEIPMLYNLLKGDIKLIGVRPLSEQYLSLYSDELKQERKKHKPGLIPPFYADLPKTLDEIMASELRYFNQFRDKPIITDTRYFFKSCKQIIINNARSN